MVTKCANPSCSTPFQYFRGGKLFLLDVRDLSGSQKKGVASAHFRTAEYFWLCDLCCVQLTMIVAGNGEAAVARTSPAAVGNERKTSAPQTATHKLLQFPRKTKTQDVRGPMDTKVKFRIGDTVYHKTDHLGTGKVRYIYRAELLVAFEKSAAGRYPKEDICKVEPHPIAPLEWGSLLHAA